MNIDSVSNIKFLVVVITVDNLAEICHVNPGTLGEVAHERCLSISCIHNWRDLKRASNHIIVSEIRLGFPCALRNIVLELKRINASTAAI